MENNELDIDIEKLTGGNSQVIVVDPVDEVEEETNTTEETPEEEKGQKSSNDREGEKPKPKQEQSNRDQRQIPAILDIRNPERFKGTLNNSRFNTPSDGVIFTFGSSDLKKLFTEIGRAASYPEIYFGDGNNEEGLPKMILMFPLTNRYVENAGTNMQISPSILNLIGGVKQKRKNNLTLAKGFRDFLKHIIESPVIYETNRSFGGKKMGYVILKPKTVLGIIFPQNEITESILISVSRAKKGNYYRVAKVPRDTTYGKPVDHSITIEEIIEEALN